MTDTVAFDITAQGCRVTATYRDEGPLADIRFWVNGELVREFPFPAYRIWNIAAHFESDFVPALLADTPPPTPEPEHCVVCGPHLYVEEYVCDDCRALIDAGLLVIVDA